MDKEAMDRAANTIRQMLRHMPVSDISVVTSSAQIVAQAKLLESYGGQWINIVFTVGG